MRRALAIILMLTAACGAPQAEQQPPETPLVQVVEASLTTNTGAVRASGLVSFRREPQLSFPASGVIETLFADAGDVVRRGQRLATLRRTGAGANANEAALARENAERELARAQALYDRGFVSEARLEGARLALERARDLSVLLAPADGIILRRSADAAQTLAAGAPVFVFGDSASGIVVRAPLSSLEAARVAPGDRAVVRAGDGASLEARVSRIAGKGAEGTGAFEAEVELLNSASLRSGTVAEVEIAASGGSSQPANMVVPALSLLDARADQGVVFVVDDANVARRRAVRTAGVTQDGVLIVEGLAVGERVIAAGAAYVRDGETVRPAAGS